MKDLWVELLAVCMRLYCSPGANYDYDYHWAEMGLGNAVFLCNELGDMATKVLLQNLGMVNLSRLCPDWVPAGPNATLASLLHPLTVANIDLSGGISTPAGEKSP